MQDETGQQSVAVSFRATAATSKTLARALASWVANRQAAHAMGARRGKVSISRLRGAGAELASVALGDAAKSFAPFARKYGLAYSLVKDASTDPPRWLAFFRAKDAEVMEAAFREYAKRELGGKERDRSVLERARDLAKRKDLERERGRTPQTEKVTGKTAGPDVSDAARKAARSRERGRER